MKTIARSAAILLLASTAGCFAADDTEPHASASARLEEDAVCTDDEGEGAQTDDINLGEGGSLPLGPESGAPLLLASSPAAPPGARTGLAGSLPSATLSLGTIQLPRQFIGRIVLDPSATCWLTANVSYSAVPAPNNQWSVTLSATVTGSCYVAIDGQRYGIIHPTIHGNTTVTVTLSGSANVTTGLDCSTVRAFTPSVTVTLAGSVSYTDPIVDVYGRCGRRRPILSNIATNQAREAAAQAAAQVQALIDAKLGEWQTAANTWLAGQVPQIASLICGATTTTTPVTGTFTPVIATALPAR